MKLNKIKNFSLNFGPQHPAAHGVLRLIININGERIERIDPHIGLLHRGTEKLAEKKNYIQNLPYFDRLDYVSAMAQEHCYSLIIESFLKLKPSNLSSSIRIIFLEITRILNHLMALTTHALDLGALTPFLWGFEVREILMEFYERASGARLHACFIVPGGTTFNCTSDLFIDINKFAITFYDRINELELMLTKNLIWSYRLKNIGKISKQFAKAFSFSGVLLRSTGISQDLRDSFPYESYGNSEINFNMFVSSNGDSLDRYLLRIAEMRESTRLIEIYSSLVLENYFKIKQNEISFNLNKNMEKMIYQFIYNTKGFTFYNYSNYISTETPKGEFGVYLVTQFENSFLYRCRIRAPGFFHLQGLHAMSKNSMLADLVAIIGTQDIVFGEIDR